MKKVILIALIIAGAFAFADDGGSYKPEDWTYGNIYVKEPNDKIALERELLVVEQINIKKYDEKSKQSRKIIGSEVTALFDFVNTSRGNVTVPCAFPVVVKTQISVKKDGTISDYIPIWPHHSADEAVIEVAFQKKNIEGLSKETLFSLDKKLRTMNIKEYKTLLSCAGAADSALKPCVIVQDGKNVPVQTVGIETNVKKNEEATLKVEEDEYSQEYAIEIYDLTLVLHFYHELHFAPSAHSNLSVKYETDSIKRSHRSTSYELTYDISTGGTWKGSMKSFMVFTDGEMTTQGSVTNFETTELGDLSPIGTIFNLYSAENYKPQKGELLLFKSWKAGGEDRSYWLKERDGMQNIVTDIRVSSFYKGSYKIAGNNWDEVNSDKNLRTSTYGVETSFDGILCNGWVEGVNGDGIGEWAEFKLNSAALGPFASNGLARFFGRKHKQYDFGYSGKYDYDKEDYTTFIKAGGEVGSTWASNNRIQSMTLSSSALKSDVTLNFADIFPARENDYSYDWIAINSVKNPIVLPKGTYRMTINSVYKGNKYDDTALGEVWFIPLSATAEKILSKDTDGFYSTPITRIVQNYIAQWISLLEEVQHKEYLRSLK